MDCERRQQSSVREERCMLDSQLDLLQQHLIVEKGLARNTLAAYMSDLQHFGLFVRARGASMFQDLSREDIIAYLAERRQQGMAARTLARELVSLKTLYRFLHGQPAGTADPTAQMQAPRQGHYLPDVLTLQEVEQLLQAPDTSTPLGKRDAALLELLYATGLRASELIALTVGDVQTTTGYVKVRGKGVKSKLACLLPCTIYRVTQAFDFTICH